MAAVNMAASIKAASSPFMAGAVALPRHAPRANRSARPLTYRAVTKAEFTLPAPPWELNALEPFMSQNQIEYHWGKHHRAYVTNLNNQTKDTELASKSIEELIVEGYSGGDLKPYFNNAAQIWNHTFFWESIKPGGGGKPSGALLEAIEKDFGSYDDFVKEFSTAAATQFGSGWAWLVVEGGKLKVTKTPNAVTPLVFPGQKPILTVDVWEHAYYLDYQNLRPKFVETFITSLVNWDEVAKRYAA